jgi:thiamine biosynthesis lipoprotein
VKQSCLAGKCKAAFIFSGHADHAAMAFRSKCATFAAQKNSMNMKHLLLLCSLGAVLLSCQEGVYYEESGSVFNTYYRIKYRSARILTAELDAELQAFNLSLNPFNPNSVVAKVNRNEAVEVDTWFTAVFEKAMEVSEKSGGFFDVTAAPLINAWGFGFARSDSISPQLIDSLKMFTGYRKIRLEGLHVIKDDPRILLNFSAIAKGYACDVVAALLERHGVSDYLVDIGGEIAMKGVNPSGNCWQVGVSKPEEDAGLLAIDVQQIFRLCRPSGFATSGNYRNFYIKDGRKVAHTINPLTGYPAEHSILSATIVAADCMTADAYATAFMVMGVDAACRMAEQIPDIAYYLICAGENDTYDIRYSDNIEPLLVR